MKKKMVGWSTEEVQSLRWFMKQSMPRNEQAKAFCRKGTSRSLSAVTQKLYLLLSADRKKSRASKINKKLSNKEAAPKPVHNMSATFQGVTVKGSTAAVMKQLDQLKVKEATIKFSY